MILVKNKNLNNKVTSSTQVMKWENCLTYMISWTQWLVIIRHLSTTNCCEDNFSLIYSWFHSYHILPQWLVCSIDVQNVPNWTPQFLLLLVLAWALNLRLHIMYTPGWNVWGECLFYEVNDPLLQVCYKP